MESGGTYGVHLASGPTFLLLTRALSTCSCDLQALVSPDSVFPGPAEWPGLAHCPFPSEPLAAPSGVPCPESQPLAGSSCPALALGVEIFSPWQGILQEGVGD